MTDVREAVVRQERWTVVVCLVPVYVLTWVVWVRRAAGVPVGMVGQLVPAVAALVAAALTGGRTGLRDRRQCRPAGGRKGHTCAG